MKRVRLLTIIFLAAMLTVASLTLTGCGAKTINLNSYLTYEITGYDGYGRVETHFDLKEFENDLLKALGIKESDAGMSDLGKLLVIETAAENGGWDQSENLSNGDTISYEWFIDAESIRKEYDVNLTWKKITETVSGLESVQTFDPFESIKVEASYGQLSISSEKYSNLIFTADKTSGVAVGDSVIIKLETSPEDCVQYYSAIPSTTEMKYTVEKMDGYMTDVSQITEELDKQIQKQLKDYVEAVYADSKENTLKKYVFQGYYLLTNKDQSNSWGTHNQLYVIYKETFDYNDDDVSETVTNYSYIKYTDAKVYADGTASVDLLNYEHPSSGWFANETFETGTGITYIGYKDLDTLYNQCVTSQKENYTVTSTVKK